MKHGSIDGMRRWAFAGWMALASLAAGASPTAAAEGGELSGSWSGGGTAVFASGKTEKARCRASFFQSGGSSYQMSATCATPSAKVAQSATLVKVGANKYSGHWHNAEYNVSGSIRITVSGRTLSASLSSEAGSGSLQLRK